MSRQNATEMIFTELHYRYVSKHCDMFWVETEGGYMPSVAGSLKAVITYEQAREAIASGDMIWSDYFQCYVSVKGYAERVT